MERLLPTQARRTLGVILAPNGSAISQIQTCKRNLETFIAKTSQCRLSTTLRCKAVKMILEPGILYPFMATLYETDELNPIICILSRLYCNALGLNEHFPRCDVSCMALLI